MLSSVCKPAVVLLYCMCTSHFFWQLFIYISFGFPVKHIFFSFFYILSTYDIYSAYVSFVYLIKYNFFIWSSFAINAVSIFQSWARDNVTIFSSRKKLLLIALCLYSLWLLHLDTEASLRWRVVAKLNKIVACPALSLFKSIFLNMRTGLYKFGGPCDIYGSNVSFHFFSFSSISM